MIKEPLKEKWRPSEMMARYRVLRRRYLFRTSNMYTRVQRRVNFLKRLNFTRRYFMYLRII